MTSAALLLRGFASAHKEGLVAIAACFAIQSAYGVLFCASGLTTFWQATLLAQLPAIGLLANRSRYASPIAAVVIQVFCLWANSAECKVYSGGGASMAYVVVFLFGWPTGLVAGLLPTWLAKLPGGDGDDEG